MGDMGFLDNGLPGTSLDEVVSAIVIVFCVVGTVVLAIRWVVNRRRKVSAAKERRRRKPMVFYGPESAMHSTVAKEGDLWIISDRGNEMRVVQPGRHRRR